MSPAERDALAAVGAQLRAAGLTSRALATWAGTARLAALPARLDAIAAPTTPAAAVLALFVAGTEVARARLALPDAVLAALIAHGLVEHTADGVRARVAVVPLGPALLVCDRLDAPVERALVCWPDDSSHHLATAITPGRRARWLDLGCGSGFAALARPALAEQIVGVDVNERAVRHAQLGAALSGIRHLEVALGDVGEDREAAELVTCNAPMPAPAAHMASMPSSVPSPIPSWAPPSINSSALPSIPSSALASIPSSIVPSIPSSAPPSIASSAPSSITSSIPPSINSSAPPSITSSIPPSINSSAPSSAPPLISSSMWSSIPEVWRQAEPGFFERLWAALPRAVRPGGLIVVHAACEAMLPALAQACGERVAVRYTPEGAPGFAVAWWRPDGPDRLVTAHRTLTPERPHLDPQDREDALAR
jgi:hypothetical protein